MLKRGHLAQTPKTKKGPTCGKMASPFKLATWIHAFRSETQESRFLEDSALLSPVLI